MFPIEVTKVYAAVPGEAFPATELVLIDGAAVSTYAIVWAMVIVGVVEGLKRFWLAKTGAKTASYQRTVALFPVLVGILTAPFFGPPLLLALSFQFSPIEALWFGPCAGAAAGWAFTLLKHTVVPMLPGVARTAFTGVVRKFGLDDGGPSSPDAVAAREQDAEDQQREE